MDGNGTVGSLRATAWDVMSAGNPLLETFVSQLTVVVGSARWGAWGLAVVTEQAHGLAVFCGLSLAGAEVASDVEFLPFGVTVTVTSDSSGC